MPIRLVPGRSELSVHTADGGAAVLRWVQNRLHYHPRIFTLLFESFERLPHDVLSTAVTDACSFAIKATEAKSPLLYRTTVDRDSTLRDPLQGFGFRGTRWVYEASLTLPTSFRCSPITDDLDLELVSLQQARERLGEDAIVDLYLEVYSRVSRLDPATPNFLSPKERTDLLFEEDLDQKSSTVALVSGTPSGIVPVFHGEFEDEREVGPFGVCSAHLSRHHKLSLAMIARAAEAASAQGASSLRFEIDSDEPYTVYVCSELPLVHRAALVSLMFTPSWKCGN